MPRLATGSIKKPLLITLAAGAAVLLTTVTVLATAEPADASGPVQKWAELAAERQGDADTENQFDQLMALAERIKSAEERTNARAGEILDKESANEFAMIGHLEINIAQGDTSDFTDNQVRALRDLNAELLDTLDAAGVLADLDELFDTAPRLVPMTEPAENLIETLLPYLSPLRTIGRVQALRITTAMEAGDATTAAAHIEDAMRLMEACHVNPTLIAQLVAAAMGARINGAVSSADGSKLPVSLVDGVEKTRRDVAARFEPYVTTREKGTGLGLPIVRKIIEEHDGTLMLSAAEPFAPATHRGAMAKITLPLPPDQSAAA